MMIKENFIEVKKTAKYAVLGELNEHTHHIWFVLHGYGQLARFFLNKFNPIFDNHTCIIAPEGFHRFYLNGFDGRVGASWMTKEERLSDIADYINYLDIIYDHIINKECFATIPDISLLGFSQGAATASRWAQNGKAKFNNLILWAGLFPPDMNITEFHNSNKTTNLFLICGDNDEYLNTESFVEPENQLLKHHVKYNKIVFSGKHNIDAIALQELRDFINKDNPFK